jgi:hypothetical protein
MLFARVALVSSAVCGFVALAIACSSSSDDAAPPTTLDASSAPDAAPPPDEPDAPFVMAAHPAPPQVVSAGGPVLVKPSIVPIFFPGFIYRDQMIDFAAKLPTTTYWKETTSEYGVGPLGAPHAAIDVADPAASIVYDGDIQRWLASRFDGTHPEFGTEPIADAIYTLYYAPGTVLQFGENPDAGTDGGTSPFKSCGDFGGYHREIDVGGKKLVYAAIAFCDRGLAGLDYSTAISTHEWAEAATDPLDVTKPAYSGVDDDHVVWAYVLPGTEVADMCEGRQDTYYRRTDIDYVVQRSWSNAAALAGQNPCVPPDTSEPYFDVAGVLPQLDTGKMLTTGITAYSGESRSVKMGYFSTAPTDDWRVDVKVYEFGAGGKLQDTTTVIASVIPASGHNGDQAQLNVHTNAHSPSGLAVVVVTSSLGKTRHEWFGLVGN